MTKNSNTRSARLYTSLSALFLAAVVMVLFSGCGSDPKYKITGTVTIDGAAFPGVTVTLSGSSSAATTTDANGNYIFNDLPGGTYSVTPSLQGYVFTPTSRPAYLSGNDAIGWTFSGAAPASTHTVYRKAVGTLWAWGNNYYGQFGTGTAAVPVNSTPTPVLITGLPAVSEIVAGGNHTVYRYGDGTVWAAGLNTNGQLGNGTTTQSNIPVQATGLSGITAVVAGDAFTAALKADGTVWAWGKNSNGQLGDGTTVDKSTPVQVAGGLTGVTAIDAGDDFTVALKGDGTVWAWGNNGNGQLGDGTTTQRTSPIQVQASLGVALSGVASILTGSSFTIAVKIIGGTYWAWGNNTYGQFCNGTAAAANAYPVQITGMELLGVTAIAAGYDHTVILKGDTTVWSCGNNASGQLGNGATIPGASSNTLVQATGLTGVTAVAAGYQGTVAVKAGDVLWAWGLNGNGQLGDTTIVTRSSPVAVNPF